MTWAGLTILQQQQHAAAGTPRFDTAAEAPIASGSPVLPAVTLLSFGALDARYPVHQANRQVTAEELAIQQQQQHSSVVPPPFGNVSLQSLSAPLPYVLRRNLILTTMTGYDLQPIARFVVSARGPAPSC
jgi:hypothetical protein